jgi:hypothetical protein
MRPNLYSGRDALAPWAGSQSSRHRKRGNEIDGAVRVCASRANCRATRAALARLRGSAVDAPWRRLPLLDIGAQTSASQTTWLDCNIFSNLVP